MKITKKRLVTLFFVLTVFSLVTFPQLTQAASGGGDLWSAQYGSDQMGSWFGQSREPEDVRVTVVRIIQIVLSLLGVIFLGLLIFSGFKWMTAGGSEDEIKKASAQIKNAIIGLIIILVSWGVTTFILKRLIEASSGIPNGYLH